MLAAIVALDLEKSDFQKSDKLLFFDYRAGRITKNLVRHMTIVQAIVAMFVY